MSKQISKFHTDRKGNQLFLRIAQGYASVAEAIVYNGDALTLTFKMDNPQIFSDFFGAKTLDEIVEIAHSQGYRDEVDPDSPLKSGVWK